MMNAEEIRIKLERVLGMEYDPGLLPDERAELADERESLVTRLLEQAKMEEKIELARLMGMGMDDGSIG